jgi:DNA-directed RNA polymerase subunit beta'
MPATVELTAKISVRLTEYTKDKATGEFTASETKVVSTTAGRALLSEILPKGLPFSNINKALKKKEISQADQRFVPQVRSERNRGLCRQAAAKRFQAGHQVRAFPSAVDDMLVPKEKHGIIERAEKEVKEIEQQYASGLVTLVSATTRWWTSGASPVTKSPRS